MQNLFKYLILILLSSNIAHAGEVPHKIKNYITSIEAKEHKFQGGAIAILYKGEVIYKKSFGFAVGTTQPITSSTLFPLASVSKVVTSTAIALMLDKNELDLDQQYTLPYLKSKVSLRNVLGNTTGYRFSGNQDIEKGMSRKQLLEKLKTLPQPCEPGKCYFYSNLCFSLVEEILAINNLSWKIAINRLIKELNTDGIKILPLPEEAQVALPHIKNKQKNGYYTLPFPEYYPKTVASSAGIFASMDGMIELYKLRFGYRPDLISDNILVLFNTPYIEADIRHWKLDYEDQIESHYSISWRVFKSKQHKNKELIFHSGMIAGINAFIGFVPSEEMGIIVLANEASGVATHKGLEFWRSFLK